MRLHCKLTLFMHIFENIYRRCIRLQVILPEDGLHGPKHVGGI
jgi:hypothetical protein